MEYELGKTLDELKENQYVLDNKLMRIGAQINKMLEGGDGKLTDKEFEAYLEEIRTGSKQKGEKTE